MKRLFTILAIMTVASASSLGQSVVDGSAVGDNYAVWLDTQLVQTGFGDNLSELNGAAGVVENGRLFLLLTGNIENNFNRLEIFIDSVPGGESVFSGDPGNDGAGVMAGLTFDEGFEADYHVTARRGFDGTIDRFDLDFAVLGTPHFSTHPNIFGGLEEGTGTTGVGPGNNFPIEVAYDNSNVAGVAGGTGSSDPVAPFLVATGFEMSVDLSDIGHPPGDIKVLGFINNSDHNFASNQFLGTLLPPQINLGGDGLGNPTGALNFDLGNFAGEQYFTIRNNDECWEASELTEGSAGSSFNSTLATPSGILASGLPPFVEEAPNTACEDLDGMPDNLHNDLWFRFTAVVNSAYTFSTCHTASYNSKLAIYSGTCGAPVALACNDNDPDCIGFTSRLDVTGLTQGTEYLVQLGGFGIGDVGGGNVRVTRRGGSQNYCSTSPNSAGSGVSITTSGTPGISSILIGSNPLVLLATGLPDDVYVFVVGPDKANQPFFGGTLCVSNPTFVGSPQFATTGGVASHTVTTSDLGNAVAWSTLFFQVLYRDSAGGLPANASDGLAVTFYP